MANKIVVKSAKVVKGAIAATKASKVNECSSCFRPLRRMSRIGRGNGAGVLCGRPDCSLYAAAYLCD